MRVLTIVLALVAIPFVAGVSQAPFQDPKNCGAHLTTAEKASQGVAHGGRHGVMDRPCGSTETPPPPPPPPPAPEPEPSACQVSSPAPTGTLTIDGKVSDGAEPWGPLPGWCVQLNGTVTATAMTGALGTYRFAGLPSGTYTVCPVVQSGWMQSFPNLFMGGATPCPNGVGWTFTVTTFSSSFLDFRYIAAQ